MFSPTRPKSRAEDLTSHSVQLGLELFEDRIVPTTIVTFISGVVYVNADQTTDDTVTITAIGAASDGSTGVRITYSTPGGPVTEDHGDAAHPVTNIALDLKDGNDTVQVADLTSVAVYVGEGNGNNNITLGAT